MLKLENPDLTREPLARRVVKHEVVSVEFAAAPGLLQSAVGPNAYAAGDALLTGSTGDRWCVSRDRFDAKYRAEAATSAGRPGSYRNIPSAVLAKRMTDAFSVARTAGGDVLRGNAGDWLVEYAPGDHGIVAAARFDRVYRVIDDDSPA
ncbi:MAG: PGDYG domain-containing protein [Gammaproteobacteria bacterium]